MSELPAWWPDYEEEQDDRDGIEKAFDHGYVIGWNNGLTECWQAVQDHMPELIAWYQAQCEHEAKASARTSSLRCKTCGARA